MMLSVTLGFWGVATFVPTYVGTVAAKAGLSAPFYSAVAGLLGTGVAIVGFISLGFCADAIGRKPTAMIWYAMCLILTPVVYMWAQSMGALLAAVTVFGFFTGGIWAWAPVWLPELFPTRMRGTAVAFCFNAPRWISCIGPLIAGTLIVGRLFVSSAVEPMDSCRQVNAFQQPVSQLCLELSLVPPSSVLEQVKPPLFLLLLANRFAPLEPLQAVCVNISAVSHPAPEQR